jgi:hypothetical protein
MEAMSTSMLTVGMAISYKPKIISFGVHIQRFWKNVMMTIEEFKSNQPKRSEYLCNFD